MKHPLDEARLKLERAQEHLAAFDADAAAFLRTSPYRFDSRVYANQWWIKPQLTAPPPARLSAIVSDVVANARTALDYVVVDLAATSSSLAVDLTGGHDRRLARFPIFADSATDKTYRRWKNRLAAHGVPAPALAAIDGSQPDVSGDPALHWLHHLATHTRHGAPALTISPGGDAQIDIEGYRNHPLSLRTPLLSSGVVVDAPADLVLAIGSGQARVHVRAVVDITCSDGALPRGPIEPMLVRMVTAVADTIDRFEPLF